MKPYRVDVRRHRLHAPRLSITCDSGTWTARPPGGSSRSTAGPPASTPTGSAAGASASTRYERPRSTTPSATGRRMHEVREFAGHSDIRTTELYFVRKEEDAEVPARRIQIRITGRKGE